MPIISEDGKIPHITTHWILVLVAECCYFPDDSFVFSHFMYMMKFVGCETLNLVNVLGQMYFMDRFMNIYSYLIFVIFFTQAKFLDNEIYTEKRQFFALSL